MRDNINKQKALVLMSGGVDSSTAAALLCEQGYAVSGVYLKLWDSADSEKLRSTDYVLPTQLGDPCWAQEMRDAAQVAAKLGIPFEIWDVTEDYKTRVLKNFYSEYAAGRTPNPDVLCNSEIKFGIALDRALAAGYDFIATGHYVRVIHETRGMRHESGKDHTSYFILHTSADKNKDQSYFLWRLTQEQLAHVLFPIGEYTKSEVRKLAQKFGLHNARKKDSQGVCFLGKIELKEFLYSRGQVTGGSDLATRRNGPIVDVHGKLLGLHDGLAHFTIGQRQGTKLGGIGPYFVVEKDNASNTLIVANIADEPKYRAIGCKMQNVKCKIDSEYRCLARVRYRAPLVGVTVQGDRVVFDEPQRAVAPGQSIVFYQDEQVIGGGVIDQVTLLSELPKVTSPELLVSKVI